MLRRRPSKGPDPRKGLHERHVWECTLCGYTAVRGSRAQLITAVHHHKDRAHKKDGAGFRGLRKPPPTVIPVVDLPMDQQAWTCATCYRGLPFGHETLWQRRCSAIAHLAQCAPGPEHETLLRRAFRPRFATETAMGGTTPSGAMAELRLPKRKDTSLLSSVRRRRAWSTLTAGTFRASLRPSLHASVASGLAQTVTRLFLQLAFQKLSHAVERGLLSDKATAKFLRRLLTIWGWGKHHVREADVTEQQQAVRCGREPPQLPKLDDQAWFGDLTEHGDVEPHPGPEPEAPPSYKVWNCNVGSWWTHGRAFRHEQVDIVVVQEHQLSYHSIKGVAKKTQAMGYQLVAMEQAPGPQGRHGQ